MVNTSCPACKRNTRTLPCICIFNCGATRCQGK